MKKRILIGVIITDCHIDYQSEILRGVITQSFKSGCDTAIIAPLHNFSVDSPYKNAEKTIFDLILSDSFDGFIYDRNTFYSETIREMIDKLLKQSGKPVMLLDYADHKSFETTSADDSIAFEVITDHLIEVHGKKKIYCLTGPRGNFGAEERLSGYKNSMKKHGLFFDKSCYDYGDYWHNAADSYAERIINGELERPEAIVCGNDIMAIRIAQKFAAAGIRVPEDVALTGFDASEDGYTSEPSITSYSRPNFQLGTEAFRRLYRIITGRICSRAPNENGSLRLGRSCGCQEDTRIRMKTRRSRKLSADFENQLLYGDMLFDITNVTSISALADRLDNYTYLIYKLAHIDICLTQKYVRSASMKSGKLDFRIGEDMQMILSKSAVMRSFPDKASFSSSDILPEYHISRDYPIAYYVTPLHYNNNFFGYAAISFGKVPFSFSNIFIQWVNYLNFALEHLRIKMMMNALSSADKAVSYEELTGLPGREFLEKELVRVSKSCASDSSLDLITVELTGVKNAYYRIDDDKMRDVMSGFSDVIRKCSHSSDICGLWDSSTFCIISDSPERAEAVYKSLAAWVRELHSDNPVTDFSVGVLSFSAGIDMSAEEMVHLSVNNRVFGCSSAGAASNPQSEKLFLLRSRIMKNPELPWNISEIAEELYLSKSYLQKIYKSYFNKSIIEEMIEFRIEKARKLLSGTDLTITEIARKCGYSSYNYFVRQFRLCEGSSPSDYREAVRKAAENES